MGIARLHVGASFEEPYHSLNHHGERSEAALGSGPILDALTRGCFRVSGVLVAALLAQLPQQLGLEQ